MRAAEERNSKTEEQDVKLGMNVEEIEGSKQKTANVTT